MYCEHPECNGKHGRAPMAACCPAYQKNRRAWVRKWKRENPLKVKKAVYDREYSLKREYGISVKDYEHILVKQGGGCAICGQQPNGKRLQVDHCHATKRNRGLLCFRCNAGIGLFNDNKATLAKAINYLA